MSDYKTIAETAYQNIWARFDPTQMTDGYWCLGNVCDTVIDYLAFAGEQPDPGFAGRAYEKYQALVGGQALGCWYDDFAWWGIAGAKAYDQTFDTIFGDQKENFQGIALDCWKTVNEGNANPEWTYKGAPNVWDNRDNGTPDETYWNSPENWATPRFGNGVGSGLQGVWQYDIFHVERPQNECSPASVANPSDPNYCYLGPFQDTVVNGLFLVLAIRLANADAPGQMLQPAKDEYGFLNAWFDETLANDSLLLRYFPDVDGTTLIRERVTTYAEIGGTYPPLKHFNNTQDTCWAGDQGLLIGGLTDCNKAGFSLLDNYQVINSIILGVANHMSSNNVIGNSYGDIGDPFDYRSGIGIFMRYLLYTYVQNPEPVTDTIKQIENVLLATTNSICGNLPDPTDLFGNFNVLSTLTTAKKLGIITF